MGASKRIGSRLGNPLEEHIEKIVFAIVGLVCIWLLISYVVFSPNVVSCDNKKLAPGGIDSYVSKQTEFLKEKLSEEPQPKAPYEPNVGLFIALTDSAVSGLTVSFEVPVPAPIPRSIIDERIYDLPLIGEDEDVIGEVTDVRVEHIRAAAYVPTTEIDEENIYSQDNSEPNDIDLVTVEAKFDVAGLCERFYENFAGAKVQEQWRDPCLANPVFAVVQLQRQEQLEDGGWSDWQIVPQARIDARRELFEVIEDFAELPPAGLTVRLYRFNNGQVRKDLLQPEAYRIASAEEEWFPPAIHEKYLSYRKELESQEKREAEIAKEEERKRKFEEAREAREAREKEREEKRKERDKTRRETGGRETGAKRRSPGGVDSRRTGTRGTRGDFAASRSTKERSTKRRERPMTVKKHESDKKGSAKSKEVLSTSIDDFYKELDEILITEESDLSKMRQLVFWAHDDTVEPEKKYRYKIRLGVFNPIAGTDKLSGQYKSYKEKVILWSEFSNVTEGVAIPEMSYFFPVKIQETTKIVTVQVCKYVLGYWYSKKFPVRLGESIGKVAKYDVEEKEEQEEQKKVEITVPESIDYSTGAVLVDVMAVSDWVGGSNLRYYFDVLYSSDGAHIGHRPVGSRYWSKELLAKYHEIERAEEKPREPLRDWSSKQSEYRRTSKPRLKQSGDRELYKKMRRRIGI